MTTDTPTRSIMTRDVPTFGAMFNIYELKRANAQAGYFFFTPDSMRFFRSRVLDDVIGGRFFVTSEQRGFDASDGRGYSVREFMPDGSIDSVSEFNEYSTSAQAKRAARKMRDQTHSYYFQGQHGANGRKVTYVVTDAVDPWNAMERLHKNFRIAHCGRAQDYMLSGDSASHYPKLVAR